jgi:hypothetical protein
MRTPQDGRTSLVKVSELVEAVEVALEVALEVAEAVEADEAEVRLIAQVHADPRTHSRRTRWTRWNQRRSRRIDQCQRWILC